MELSLWNIHKGHELHISDQPTSFLAAQPMYFPRDRVKKIHRAKKRHLIFTFELKPEAEVFFSIMQVTPNMDLSL